MSRSPQRILALVLMLVIAPGAALLVFVGWLLVAGFEGHEPVGADWAFLALSLVGLAATVGAISGLAVGSRPTTGVSVLGQAGAATALLVLWATTPDFRIGEDDTELVFALIGVYVADLVALSAILMPRKAARPASAPASIASGRLTNATLVGGVVVVLWSFALLLRYAVGPGAGIPLDRGIAALIGVAGGVGCGLGLWLRRKQLAAGVAIAQAVLAALLLVWFRPQPAADVESFLVAVLLVDALTVWVGYGPRRSVHRAA